MSSRANNSLTNDTAAIYVETKKKELVSLHHRIHISHINLEKAHSCREGT